MSTGAITNGGSVPPPPHTRSARSLRSAPFLLGLFLVSASVLGLEVLDTRLLSVLTWYSLAFLVIAMGLFGLTAGAVHVYLHREDYAPERLSAALAKDALWLSLAIPVSYVLLLIVPLRTERVATTVPLFVFFAAAIALPFYPAGKVVAAALTRSPLPVGRVYAVDLVGAALAAPLVPTLLEKLGGGSAILSLSLVSSVAAYSFARAAGESRLARNALLLLGACMALTLGNTLSMRGLVPLWVKGRPETRDEVALELWNSHSRVLVTRPLLLPAAMWGKGQKCARQHGAAARGRYRRPRGHAALPGGRRSRRSSASWSATSPTPSTPFAPTAGWPSSGSAAPATSRRRCSPGTRRWSASS